LYEQTSEWDIHLYSVACTAAIPFCAKHFLFFLKVHACVYNTVIKGNTLNDWQKRATTFAAIACAGV